MVDWGTRCTRHQEANTRKQQMRNMSSTCPRGPCTADCNPQGSIINRCWNKEFSNGEPVHASTHFLGGIGAAIHVDIYFLGVFGEWVYIPNDPEYLVWHMITFSLSARSLDATSYLKPPWESPCQLHADFPPRVVSFELDS